MFGTHAFGTEEFAVAPEEIAAVTRTGGGGWSHRGAVTLPRRRPTGLPSLPKLPKPPYLFFTEPADG